MALDLCERLPCSEDFRSAFAAQNAAQPTVKWHPETRDLSNPILRGFHSFCQSLTFEDDTIDFDAFRAELPEHFLNFLAILRPVHSSPAFVFEHFGEDIMSTRSRNLTGETTEGLDSHIRVLLETLSAATLQAKAPVLCVHEPVRDAFATTRTSYIRGLTAANGEDPRVACLTVNDNVLQPGLDALSEPAFVVRGDGKVVFANEMAQRMFGFRAFPGDPVTLAEYTGIDFAPSPEASADGVFLKEERQICVLDKLLVDMSLSARMVLFRDEPVFVILARPC